PLRGGRPLLRRRRAAPGDSVQPRHPTRCQPGARRRGPLAARGRQLDARGAGHRGGVRGGGRDPAVAPPGPDLRRLPDRHLPGPPRRRPGPSATHERPDPCLRRPARAPAGAGGARPGADALVEPLVVSPSEDLAMVAQRFAHRMPRVVRWVLDGLGTPDAQSADLMSYLLFDAAYTRALVEIGHRDAGERIDEIEEFLRAGRTASARRGRKSSPDRDPDAARQTG